MNDTLFHPDDCLRAAGEGETAVLRGGEPVFQCPDPALAQWYIRLFSVLSPDYALLMEDVRLWAERELHMRLSPRGLLSVFDVLSPAPERPMPPMNPLPLVASLYPQEYDVACYVAQQVEMRFGRVLTEEQVNAFVAALIRDQLDAVDTGPALGSITALLLDMKAIIREQLALELNPHEDNCRRFLVHLRFLAARVLGDEPTLHEVDPEWYAEFTEQYPNAYQCTLKIAQMLGSKYHHPIGVDERMYLLIHLAQLLRVLQE